MLQACGSPVLWGLVFVNVSDARASNSMRANQVHVRTDDIGASFLPSPVGPGSYIVYARLLGDGTLAPSTAKWRRVVN